MGVNSHKPGEQPKAKEDSRVPPYNANGHFDDQPKLCHTKLSELRKAADREVVKQQERQPEEVSHLSTSFAHITIYDCSN